MFWKKVFSPNSEQSWGRVASALALVFGLAWITRLILIITTPDQFDKLGSVGMFILAVTGLISALYGISKGLDTIKSVKGGTNEPPAA